MSRGTAPIIQCDGDDMFCGAWDIDHYETGATAVNRTPVTASERSPGWTTRGDEDYCPEHSKDAER